MHRVARTGFRLKLRVAVMLGSVLLASLLLLASCASTTATTTPGTTSTTPPPTISSLANGRNIYLYSQTLSGDFINYVGGPGGMMRLACVNCHGTDARGGEVFLMMQVFDVPDITWPELTGTHEDHQPYTVDTVKQAITDGLDPAGEFLDYPMPVWRISGQNLDDLITYMMTLD